MSVVTSEGQAFPTLDGYCLVEDSVGFPVLRECTVEKRIPDSVLPDASVPVYILLTEESWLYVADGETFFTKDRAVDAWRALHRLLLDKRNKRLMELSYVEDKIAEVKEVIRMVQQGVTNDTGCF